MSADLPNVDQDQAPAPAAQEIEFALILQRMITKATDDPSQMRLAIYEFARARLKVDTSWADQAERERLLNALEIAIRGVERFSVDRGHLLAPPNSQGQIGQARSSSTALSTVEPFNPAAEDIIVPNRSYRAPEIQVVEVRRPRPPIALLCVIAVVIASTVAVAYHQRARFAPAGELTGSIAKAETDPSASVSSTAGQKPVAGPGFPLPTDYGIYALNGDRLSELSSLAERVPDKRIAMSTPVNQPSRTTLGDGKLKFILFRRDLLGNAPERVEVRVVARVVRALTFDSKGKRDLTPVSDAWNIRNFSYELRVRPIPGNPEMLLVQSENPDFELSPGRYVLVLGQQGYDFTVAGEINDVHQCLERTDAMNGSFYSECEKL
jgi:hypothetical protein